MQVSNASIMNIVFYHFILMCYNVILINFFRKRECKYNGCIIFNYFSFYLFYFI